MSEKSTAKRPAKRRFSQDFSMEKHGRVTDSSFAPACDVNAIVKHYEATGLDPFVERLKLAKGGEASTTSYEDAMRRKAELDSAFQNQPDAIRGQFRNDPLAWYEYLAESASEEATEPPFVPAPQDASAAEKDEKVQ